MTEHLLPDTHETPEDVASLYSWANLHGGKYRDFSASRAQMREKTRQRMEQVIEEERFRVQQEAEAQRAARAAVAGEGAHHMDFTSDHTAQPEAQEAAQAAAGESAQHETQAVHQDGAHPAPEAAVQPGEPASQDAIESPSHAPESESAPPSPWQRPAVPSIFAPVRDEAHSEQRTSWLAGEPRENTSRPAWLMPERPENAQPAVSSSSQDTLQGSRDRIVSRWFALRSIFEDNVPLPPGPTAELARPPVLAVFSLAGGVGKSSLAATLARMLSARSERVLLVDTAAYGLLPFFFGARDQRPGALRTFNPPMASGDAPIQMISLDPQSLGVEASNTEALAVEIEKYARGVGRVIVDLATASGATARRILRLSPQILVPLVPDMSSVVSVSSIDTFFDHTFAASAKPTLPYYVLNQFDPSLPLHLDIREVLREQLGDRLLPFALRHSPAVSEALAEGMTVMDYAPNSVLSEDYANLAGWVKSLSAPASNSFRGVRWSER